MSPYLELKPLEKPDEPRFGNDRYEGFVVDFMDALAEKKNFKYTLEGMLMIELRTYKRKRISKKGKAKKCISPHLSLYRWINGEILIADSDSWINGEILIADSDSLQKTACRNYLPFSNIPKGSESNRQKL